MSVALQLLLMTVCVFVVYVCLSTMSARVEAFVHRSENKFHAMVVRAGYEYSRESLRRLSFIAFLVLTIFGLVVSPFAALMFPFLGGGAALGFVVFRIRVRDREQSNNFDEACFSLARSLRSGQSFTQAVMTTAQAYPRVGLLHEMSSFNGSGISMGMVMDHVDGHREEITNLQEGLLASSLIYAYELGENSARIFERIGEYFHHMKNVTADVHAGLAQIRISTLVIGALPVVMVGLGLLTGSDSTMFLITHPIGWICLLVGGVLEFVGIYWMRAMVHKGVGKWLS